MYSQTPSGKASKGTVKVIASHGRLQLRFRYGGKRHYLSLGLPNTPTNRIAADRKAQHIYLDIVSGNFDSTLEKYKPQSAIALDSPDITPKVTPNALGLLKSYIEYKASSWKATTLGDRENLVRQLSKIPETSITDALKVKQELEKVTTTDQVRRVLIQLNAACRWAVKHRMIDSNPYEGMASELPKPRYQLEPRPNAFSEDERDRVIQAFMNHKGTWNGRGISGTGYAHYASLVEFWFLTGCRPSEGIALQWKHVSEDCGTIHFEESVTMAGLGKPTRVRGSKNNKTRFFPCSPRLRSLLTSIRPEQAKPDDLVFPSPKKVFEKS
ncbi:MAG: DUF3596 domain-containing protein [Elainellaceae cyanobacterium]